MLLPFLTPRTLTVEDELVSALRGGNEVRARELLLDGLNVNGLYPIRPGSPSLDPVLRFANERPSLCRMLIDMGADPNIPGMDGMTPLDEACCLDADFVPEVIEILVKGGANIDSPPGRSSPLHLAALHGREPAVRTLLRFGADKNKRNERGESPVHVALKVPRGPHKEVIKALIEAGADLTLKNADGVSAEDAIRSMKLNNLLPDKLIETPD
jgi:hypothetical protein